jgi:hypothetical protein
MAICHLPLASHIQGYLTHRSILTDLHSDSSSTLGTPREVCSLHLYILGDEQAGAHIYFLNYSWLADSICEQTGKRKEIRPPL